jgi:hypothetical protein
VVVKGRAEGSGFRVRRRGSQGSGFRHNAYRVENFIVYWQLPCGSGFPAATIEAESLFHKKTHLLAETVKPGVMGHRTLNPEPFSLLPEPLPPLF